MKRFTETLKWRDPWFRKLPPELKCLWSWMCDNCDAAGVLDIDWETASFEIGKHVDEKVLNTFGKRIEKVNGKFWIVKFIPFQYPHLSKDCKPHAPVFVSLSKHNLIERYSKGIERVQDPETDPETESDKEKDKETVKDKVAGERRKKSQIL